MGAPSEGEARPRGTRGRGRRITRSADFDRVYREGRSHASRHLVLYSFPREGGEAPRLGVSVGRRVGNAVERNRVKRMLREGFWASSRDLVEERDFVLIARPEAGDLARAQGGRGVEEALRALLSRAGLLRADAP